MDKQDHLIKQLEENKVKAIEEFKEAKFKLEFLQELLVPLKNEGSIMKPRQQNQYVDDE